MVVSFAVEPDSPEEDGLPPNWENEDIKGDWYENYSDMDLLVWPGQDDFLHSVENKVGLFTGAGYGKCLWKSTELLKHSGAVVRADQIRLGDLLMGPDSTPRKVLEIHRGVDVLYEIIPVKGEPFKVTGNHRLTLSRSYGKGKTQKKGELLDVTVLEWLGWSATRKTQWKLVRTGVSFPILSGPLPVEPYFLGMLLGDGSLLKTPNITTMDKCNEDEVRRQAQLWGLTVTEEGKSGHGRARTYNLSGRRGKENPLTGALRSLGLWGHKGDTKFIPPSYKTASREDRLQLLAGLMDTDGSNNSGCYDYISKSKQLAEDVVFVARSLGFDARVAECRKGCQTGTVVTYYRVGINGGNEIPARLRPLPERKQIKNVLHTGFSVREVGAGEYVGFTLDGDHRFLLADFTITHNSGILIRKAVKHSCEEDGWWERCYDWRGNPLKYLLGAPQNKYLVTRLIPGFKGELDHWKQIIGRDLRAETGRNGDGFFAGASEIRQEMANGVTFYFYSLHDEKSAVGADMSFVGVDEGTMLKNPSIWNRVQQRRRDPRAQRRVTAVVGTPEKGSFLYNDFFDHNEMPKPGVAVFTDSSLKNPLLDEQFFDVLEGATDAYIDAQVMGKFVKGISGQKFADVFQEERHMCPVNIGPHQAGPMFDIGWDPGSSSGSIIIAYYKASVKKWYVVDEINIGFGSVHGTEDGCRELLRRGYNKRNIRRIFMDPKDATKHHSTGGGNVTDENTVYKIMGIRPRVTSIEGFNAHLRTRIEVLRKMFKEDRIMLNEKLRMRNRMARGLVNSLNNFATEPSKIDDTRFIDVPTSDTKKDWKHSIDALHYILMNYECEDYRAVKRNQQARVHKPHKRHGGR